MLAEISRTLSVLLVSILMLFTVILVKKGFHNRANRYLTIYLLSQIPGILAFAFYPFCTGKHAYLFYAFGQAVAILWGFFYYLFFQSLLDPTFRFRRIHALNLIPSIAAFLYAILTLHSPSSESLLTKRIFLNPYQLLQLLFNISIISYLFAMVRRYRSVSKKNPGISKNSWMRIVLWGFIVSCVFVQLGNLAGSFLPISYTTLRISGFGIFLIFFTILFYKGISQPGLILYKKHNKQRAKPNTVKQLKQLDCYMQENKPYLNPELKLATLADSVGLTPHELSQLINQCKGQSFNDYINSFRIRYAMNLLRCMEHAQDTLFGILLDSGFNSKTTFYKVFKQFNGCSPNEYRCRFNTTSPLLSLE